MTDIPRRALVLAAHGSRRQASNDEVEALSARLRKGAEGLFDPVTYGFLELVQPDIDSAIRQCIDAGVDEIVVVPYFLSAGNHVAEDLPALIEQARVSYPHTRIQLRPHLGTVEGVVGLLLGLAQGGA